MMQEKGTPLTVADLEQVVERVVGAKVDSAVQSMRTYTDTAIEATAKSDPKSVIKANTLILVSIDLLEIN